MPDIELCFDSKAPHAQKVAARQAARMVTEVTRETKRAIRAVIVRSIRDGISPYDTAGVVKQLIGLTTKQSMAAMNFRAALLAEGLPPGKVETATARYAAKLLRARAETIARTEVMSALNVGRREGWRQARAAGLVTDDATRFVIVTPDERLCPICGAMDGATAPLGKPYSAARGMGPPWHPRCRCTEGLSPDAIVATK